MRRRVNGEMAYDVSKDGSEFETSGAARLITRCHIAEDFNPQRA